MLHITQRFKSLKTLENTNWLVIWYIILKVKTYTNCEYDRKFSPRDYHLLPPLKWRSGGNKFEEDCDVEAVWHDVWWHRTWFDYNRKEKALFTVWLMRQLLRSVCEKNSGRASNWICIILTGFTFNDPKMYEVYAYFPSNSSMSYMNINLPLFNGAMNFDSSPSSNT